jgi:hypothetical protein
MAKQDKEGTPLSAKEAHALLAAVRFSAIFPVLKEPDFAMLMALAFAGFRVDANGYANPLVRKRLADEASRNSDFATRLRDLAAAAAAAPQPSVRTAAPSPVAPTHSHVRDTPDAAVNTAYRVERDRLKKERDEEADRRRSAENELGQARMDALAANVARTDAERELARVKQRAERLERKLRREEQTTAELRKAIAVSSALPAAPRHESAHAAPAPPVVRDRTAWEFVEAVRRHLDKSHGSVARQIAADVLRHAPENEIALDIHARALEAGGDAKSAIADLRALLHFQIGHAEHTEGATTLARLFAISPDTKAARDYFTALASSNADMDAIKELFDKLRGTQSDIHKSLSEAAHGDIAAALFAERPKSRTSPDDPLPITVPVAVGRVATGRLIVAWINRNQIEAVQAVRSAISSASDADKATVAAAVAAASDGDTTYYRLLARSVLAGPVVVDASNVAWHGQEMIAAPKPRMSQVLAVRKALRARGNFPIMMVADANLPFVVDDTALARRMVADGEISLVTSGTDADEYILREAKRLRIPAVTNDYMADWDPDQQVAKLQYSIAQNDGRATIYE